MSKDNNDNVDMRSGSTEAPPGVTMQPAVVKLPAVIPPVMPPAKGGRNKRRWLKRGPLLLMLMLAVAGAGYWWLHTRTGLPPGIASGNGRLEADEIDIDTKFAGRIAKLNADEGDLVRAGQVVALMDTQDLQASLRKAQAVVRQAQKTLDEANATVEQQKSQTLLAQQELGRAQFLVQKGYMPKETLDQRQQQMDGAVAAQNASIAKVGEAEHALDAAKHDVELYSVNIADNALVAPRDGRIQYRVANVGEVLAAGGKIFTILDTSYVYMDIYLPTVDAGRIKIGSDARVFLDAYPSRPIPAAVTFIASQAQFTPKTVETKDEREKLMFRIRVRIDPELLRAHADAVRSGLPGVAYVRTDPAVAWPPQLRGDAPQ
ncbi:MAG TPA: HlyD family efflux transporter periplasmic adaptor subunit [Stellaceae bacterium]|nr:HlyD family efflux transporter periplasmic adaptor subunit [Stellaceae bacterium]